MRGRRHEVVAPRRHPGFLRHAHQLAARQQRRDVRRAADGDAEAGHRGADQHDGIAELRSAAHSRGGQARALEPAAPAEPGLLGAGVGVMQQRIVGERRQRVRNAAAAERAAGSPPETTPRGSAARRAVRVPAKGRSGWRDRWRRAGNP